MKNTVRSITLVSLLAALLIAPMVAATYQTEGYTGASGSNLSEWTVVTTAATSVSSTGYIETFAPYYSGGGGAHITRNGTPVVSYYLAGQYGYDSDSGSASGLAAGTFVVYQGYNGPPYGMYGNIVTTISW